MRIGIYPGSFDPLTYGHLDIIKRAIKLGDKLVIAIAANSTKEAFFSIDERIDIIRNCCNDIHGDFGVTSFKGLLVDYCRDNKISFIVRGLRSVLDFEYENSMSSVNNRLASDVETVFLMARSENSFISSNIVKEIAGYHGDISSLVPQFVQKKVQQKFSTIQ